MALGFGAQQMVGDLLAGFFLFAEHQFGFGDVIRLSMPGQPVGITGTVEELTLRVTRIRNAQGELVTIPNSALRQVTNLSKDWSRAVVDVPIPVDEDLGRVTRTLREMMDALAADEHWSGLLLGEPVVAGVETIEVGYVQLRLIARTLPGKQFEVGRELRYRAATALRAAGISSPTIDGSAPEPGEGRRSARGARASGRPSRTRALVDGAGHGALRRAGGALPPRAHPGRPGLPGGHTGAGRHTHDLPDDDVDLGLPTTTSPSSTSTTTTRPSGSTTTTRPSGSTTTTRPSGSTTTTRPSGSTTTMSTGPGSSTTGPAGSSTG